MRKRKIKVYTLIALLVLVLFFGVYFGLKMVQNDQIKNFDDCVNAGNPIIDTKPRSCIANNELFEENVFRVYCTKEQRNVDVCIESFSPVCGYIPLECFVPPCDTRKQTFSNSCFACSNKDVLYYYDGEC